MLVLSSCGRQSLPTIAYGDRTSETERLAAKELRRYLYLRTGKLAEIREVTSVEEVPAYAVVLATEGGKLAGMCGADPANLTDESYLLKTVDKRLFVTGGSDIALLYGTYKLAEHLGIRFYLHGDVIPDRQSESFELPVVDKIYTPLFAIRGILPFHDFPEGPDWWTMNAYKAVLSQMPKMGMNFIGFHNYPQVNIGPEPMVWIGSKDDLDENGKVQFAYPAWHFTTTSGPGWGYAPKLTSDYSFGAADWYSKDIYGLDYMNNRSSGQTQQESIDLFNDVSAFFGEAFTYARRNGIRVCIGTETPMTIPREVKERLRRNGLNPEAKDIARKLYEGSFSWIKKHYPIDYYWLWTTEGWTWSGNTQQQLDAVMNDMQSALLALQDVQAGFKLATCGWVLGPQQNRAYFDQRLPKEIPFSCINRSVGFTPIDPDFAGISGRSKWAIPWMEDDPAMTIPQLWAGRMRRDAADALAYGCDGLIGIHWRTRSISPNIAALANAGWDQQGWNPDPGRKMTREQAAENAVKLKRDLDATDFYVDWATSEFGSEVADQAAKLFVRLDGGPLDENHNKWTSNIMRPATWVKGPGGLQPDSLDWSRRSRDYAYVDEMEALRPSVKGNGNLDRFDYWLNAFRYIRAVGELSCTIGAYDRKLKEVQNVGDEKLRKERAKTELLPLRIESVKQLRTVHQHLFAFIETYGELGNLTNWQQHVMDLSFDKPAEELEKLMGEKLPLEAFPDKTPVYPARIVVPEVRTMLDKDEAFTMQVIVTEKVPESVVLKYRMLGETEYRIAPLQHVSRQVYKVSILTDQIADDFEYYVEVKKASGDALVFPATAPTINQTVVIRGK